MHLLSLRRGLLAGLIYGLILAPASLALATLLLQRSMATAPPVITDFTLGLLLWTVGVSALVGALVGGLGGAWLERRPTWYIHLLPPFFLVPLALVELPTFRPLLLLLPLGLAHGGSLLLWRWLAPRCAGAPAIHRALGVALLPVLALGGWWAAPRPERVSAPRAEAAPSLLWVVFDTTRADRAARAEVAPTLARLRAEGSSFDNAWSVAPWTLPSHASMMTGRYPSSHGCQDDHRFLDTTVPSLAELLQAQGYATGLFSSNPWLGSATGLDRGFDHDFPAWALPTFAGWFPAALPALSWLVPDKGAREATEAFSRWMPEEGPFFAMINLLESHVPYHQLADPTVFLPEPSRQRQAAAASKRYNEFLELDPAGSPPTAEELPLLLALHDAGVYADDVQLAALVALLERRGRSQDTLLLITSDHGELFGEAGLWEHHVSLEDAVLRVPLVLRFPGKVPAGRSIPQAVSGVDLLPTVLELLGLGRLLPAGVQGRSLLPLLAGEGGEVPIFAESQPGEGEMLRRRAVAWGLPTTPMRREIRGKDRILAPFSPDPSAGPAQDLDPATRARLEALGYQEGE